MPAKSITVRIPENILAEIELRVASENKDRTAVILDLLLDALGMPSNSSVEGTAIADLTKKVLQLADQIQDIDLVQDSILRRLAEVEKDSSKATVSHRKTESKTRQSKAIKVEPVEVAEERLGPMSQREMGKLLGRDHKTLTKIPVNTPTQMMIRNKLYNVTCIEKGRAGKPSQWIADPKSKN